jgi:hypothetical protein
LICQVLLSSRGDEKNQEESAEVIVGRRNVTEGPNPKLRSRYFNCGSEGRHSKES